LGHFFIAILGGNSQIFGILLPRLDATSPRAIFFAHKFTPAGVAILGHFFIPTFPCQSGLKLLAFRLKLGGRGSCRAKTAASSEWRVANSERKIANGFLEGSGLEGRASARPQNFGTAGAVPFRIFRRMNSALKNPSSITG